ncbi:MAG: helix-turn-helix transcriptional regulator [Rhodospirillaceae bacterium]|nr:helix-turn-helix transcriptional regulator [Rhodospirillaceae bacterium]
MEGQALDTSAIDQQIARRVKALRSERGWSLDALAQRTGVSRATLSRLENAEVSPTAAVLGRLSTAFGLTPSRLMYLAEGGFSPVVRDADQPVWTDPETGFRRRQVSPPAPDLAGEVLECTLPPGTRIAYTRAPRPGLEHHLVMLEGRLTHTAEGRTCELGPGDCLRYRLFESSLFQTPADVGARYILFVV